MIAPIEQVECARAELLMALRWIEHERPDQARYCVEAAIERLELVMEEGRVE